MLNLFTMRKIFLGSVLFIALAACNNTVAEDEAINTEFTPVEVTTPVPDSGAIITPGETPVAAPVTPAPAAASAPRLNPPHGQPGHDCAVAVGAPLPAASSPSIQPRPLQAPLPSAAPALAPTAKGMNPPHGQPGHRCDIPVGSPLSSAPATPSPVQSVLNTTPAATTMPVTTPSLTTTPQVTTPVMAAMGSAAATETKPGMNPPHGQPGHDCAIPVGAPLKKS